MDKKPAKICPLVKVHETSNAVLENTNKKIRKIYNFFKYIFENERKICKERDKEYNTALSLHFVMFSNFIATNIHNTLR